MRKLDQHSAFLSMDEKNLKHFLEEKAAFYNRSAFIINDPISIPHRFSQRQDIEIAGFLAATLSWGRRPQIIGALLRLLELMDGEPYAFIVHAPAKEYIRFHSFVYRTFCYSDLLWFLSALKTLYQNHENMEEAFLIGYRTNGSVKEGISVLREMFLKTDHLERSEKHFADPAKGSAAKRLNMFLRWMVRNDTNGVDFGLWNQVSPAHLMCPLDVHSGTVARKLGLLRCRHDNWSAVEELTASLRIFEPADPVKYDFALFGMGVTGI